MNIQSLYVNLPVTDLPRSVNFFTALGFTFNPKFTNNDATCMIVNEHIQVMLLTKPFFAGFTNKPIADAKQTTQVLLSMSVDSRDAVNALMDKAKDAGGIEENPAKDYGFMYQRGFFDLDGHGWEVFYMNEAEFEQQQAHSK
jgi:predicted lactoylglutathione lyase